MPRAWLSAPINLKALVNSYNPTTMRKLISLVLLTASLSHAIQLPFDIGNLWPLRTPSSESSPVVETPRQPRIAIIGAGAGGSSAAFWIAKAKERSGLDVGIDIYERNDYIGGRKLLFSCE